MDQMIYWIGAEGTGHWFFYAFPCILVLLLILFRGQRVKFLIPCIIISIVIVNPIFSSKWENLGLYAYWRVLWVVPVIPIVASIVPCLYRRISEICTGEDQKLRYINLRLLGKTAVVIVGVSFVIIAGSYIYNGTGGSFFKATNSVKIPGFVTDIIDQLKEINNHPRVLFQNPIGMYARQYSGEVEQLYGRNIDGYILSASENAKKVYEELSDQEGDLQFVATMMVNDGYDYLVMNPSGREEQLAEAGFEKVDQIADYCIYFTHGTPTVIKQRNELGQVITVTTVDEGGNPIRDDACYTTVSYDYDGNGFIKKESYTDIDGKPVTDGYGCSGYERKYDRYGHKIMERRIDAAGNSIVNGLGYAEYRREYRGNNLINESYYGTEGQLVNCINGFARVEYKYDNNNNVIFQRFLDIDNNMVITGSGFAEVHRLFEGTHLLREEYYDTNGIPYSQPGGYVAIEQKWDGDSLASRTYLGPDGAMVNRIDGYAKVIWKTDEKDCTSVHFYNSDDTEIDITNLNLARDVKGNKDGWSDWLAPELNKENSRKRIGTMNLGPKEKGDVYTCTIEIEYNNVTATTGYPFLFQTQGAVDKNWTVGNIWYPNVVRISKVPNEEIYRYVSTVEINDAQALANEFEIGFRCDYWNSGAFRVRNVKIEKSDKSGEWSPGV